MKRIIFIINLMFFAQIVVGQTETNDLILVQGKVKSLKEVSYKAIVENDSFIKTNKEWENKSSDDRLYLFDENGNLVERQTLVNDNILRIDEFKYTDNRIYRSDMLYHTTFYSYDSIDRLASVVLLDRQPNMVSSNNLKIISTETFYKYVYNYKEDKIVSKDILNKKNEKIGEESHTYSNNNLVKTAIQEGEYDMWFEFKYDHKNNLILEECYDKIGGLFEKTIFTYEDTLLKKEVWSLYLNGALEGDVTYEFDDFKNEIKVIETDTEDLDTITWVYEYIYDEKNNWTQQLTTLTIDNKKTYFIVEREIEYYE